jgi:hypothetical protein
LISLETAKEKSLEILGNVWKNLEFPWNFLGKTWKSLERLGAAAIGYATPIGRRRLATEALTARRGGGTSLRNPFKSGPRAGKSRRGPTLLFHAAFALAAALP